MVTEYVTLRVRVVGVELARVAVPVIVTEKVVVDPTLPLKVTTSVSFRPAVKVTGLVVGVTTRPLPPVMVEDRVTGPVKPAEFTAADPEGRLPMVRVSVAELPELKLIAGPVGVPLEVVMLKAWGLTITETLFAFVWSGNAPFAANVPVPVALTTYWPVVVSGRRSPPVYVSVAVPEAPGIEVGLIVAVRTGLVTGETAPLVNATAPVYPSDVTTTLATPLCPAGQAAPWVVAGHQKGRNKFVVLPPTVNPKS